MLTKDKIRDIDGPKSRGFTLIEVVITVVVVAIAMLAFMGSNIAVSQSAEAAYERSIAIQDAQQVVERMRNAAQTGTFPANVITSFSNGGTVAGFSNLDTELVSVAYVDTTANPLDATVSVTWQENGVRTATAQIRTLITQRSV